MVFKKLLTSITLLMVFVVAMQAQITVTLVDGEGKPVSEATVEANKKVIGKTDAEGATIIDASYLNQQLCFTHVNFQLYCEKITKSVNKITLKSNDNFLDAAVVTSYENTTRRNTIGNVSSIDMSKVPVLNTSNALSALQGLAPGLDITVPSGTPGQASKVRIQGDQSLLFSAPPIYVIDGMVISEFSNYSGQTIVGTEYFQSIPGQFHRGNYLDFIDLSTVESITILKDADAVAIYGSRGANGAIVIKTKIAKQSKITFSGTTFITSLNRRVELMNTEEYLYARRTAIKNDGISDISGSAFYDLTLFDTTENNDWQDIVFGKSVINYIAGVNISTVSETSSNSFNIRFSPNRNILNENSDFKDLSISNNYNVKLFNEKLSISSITNIGYSNGYEKGRSLSVFATTAPPNFPRELYSTTEIENQYKGKSVYINGVSDILFNNHNLYKYYKVPIQSVLNMSYKINNYVNYDFNVGVNKVTNEDKLIESYPTYVNQLRPNLINKYQISNSNSTSINVETFLNYTRSSILNFFDISNTIGATYNESKTNLYRIIFDGNTDDDRIDNLGFYSGLMDNKEYLIRYKYMGFFNRLILGYKNFQVNSSLRYDGSSRFSPESRWNAFYSIGFSWLVSDYLKKNNELYIKLRGSYGKLGNDNIPDYGYYETYIAGRTVNYPNNMVILPSTMYVKKFRWERVSKMNIGADIQYRNFNFVINYSLNTARDQLINYVIPEYLGQKTIFRNSPAVIRNSSFEVSGGYKIHINSVSNLNIQFNLTIPYDKLIAFENLEYSSYSNMYSIGKSVQLGRFFNYAGVDTVSGLYSYYSKNGGLTQNINLSEVDLLPVNVKYYGAILLSGVINRKLSISSNIFFKSQRSSLVSSGYYSAGLYNAGVMMNNYKKLIQNWDSDRTSDYQKLTTAYTTVPIDKNRLNTYFLRINNLSLNYNLSQNVSLVAYVNNILIKTNTDFLNYESFTNTSAPIPMTYGVNFNLKF